MSVCLQVDQPLTVSLIHTCEGREFHRVICKLALLASASTVWLTVDSFGKHERTTTTTEPTVYIVFYCDGVKSKEVQIPNETGPMRSILLWDRV